ncbi:MAG: MFS transporter [Sporolactobacillus sp.]
MVKERMRDFSGLVALSLIMFIVTLDSTITNIALPTITTDFNADLANSNWFSTIYVLILSVFMIPASKLADQLGRKRIMLIGLTLFGFGSVLCGLAHSLLFLIAMRGVQGLGGAIATPVLIPLSVEFFGRKKANQAVGVIGAVSAIAAAAGPPIGGLFIRWMTWHVIFFVNVPIVLIAIVLTRICFTESYDNTITQTLDMKGMFLLSISLFFLTFVLLKGYDAGWMSAKIVSMIIGALASFVLFLVVERQTNEPFIEFNLFHESTFTVSTVMYFMCGFSIVCSSVIFNFFLENVRDFTALHAAFIIMFTSLAVIVAMPLGSWFARRYDYRPVIFSGTALMSVSVLMLVHLRMNTPISVMILDMITLGFGFGLTSLSIVSAVQFIPQAKAGMASGIVNAARQLGTCLGIALLVGMMNHNIDVAKVQIEQQAMASLHALQVSNKARFIAMNDLKASPPNKSISNNQRSNDMWLRTYEGQYPQLKRAVSNIRQTVKERMTVAFTKTFDVAGLLILLSSVFGLFTDRQKSADTKVGRGGNKE